MRKVRAAESVAMALDGVEAAFVPLKRQLGDVGLSKTVQKKIKGIQLAIEALRATLHAKVQPRSEFVCVETAMHHLQKRIEAEKRAPPKVDADATETDEPSAVEGDVWSMNDEEDAKVNTKKRLSTEALDTESERDEVNGKKARILIKPEPIPEYNEETLSGADIPQWKMDVQEEKKAENVQVEPTKNDTMADVFGGGWNDDSTEDEDETMLSKNLTPVQKPEPVNAPTMASLSVANLQRKEPVKEASSDSSSEESEQEKTLPPPRTTIADIEAIVSALSSSSEDEEEITKERILPRVPRPVFAPIARTAHEAAASESSSEEDEPFPKKHLMSAPKVMVDLWPCLNEMYDAIVRPSKPLLLAKNFSFPDTYSNLDEYVANMKLAILEEALTGIQDVNQQSSVVDKVRFLSLSIYTPRLNVVSFSLPEKLTLTNHDLISVLRTKGDQKIPYRGIVYSAANTNTKEVTIIISQKHTIEPGMYSIKILSNLTTSSREYQAISSLPTLPTVLRRLIVDAEVSNTSFGKGAGIRPLMLASLEKQYNHAQLAAIKAAVENPLTLIQGPPGTGKTRTIVGLIGALLSGSGMQTSTHTKSRVCVGASLGLKLSEKDRAAMNVRILVTAPSNAAVDVLIARLQADGVYNVKTKSFEVPKMVRIGAVPGLKDMPTSLKKHYKHTNTSIYLEHMLEQQHGTRRDHSWNPMLARQELLEKAQIVFCTLSGAGSISMCDFRQSFDAVIVDEAAQV
ncbi:hypothetical protein THRCLA_08751 [Thraustotheca clavata]|uniref:DNA2/NAM7 helicase helicase domain-containing protein n=1 Tax=Thraustotheca clavata TaxID=74557 RepID=A0A1V9Z2N1_9STRA|nr:hypothetical protein THRCLA_08751 [Thraustotheca clavata]